MSDSISKYYDDLEDKKWWDDKAKEKNKSRFEKIYTFICKIINF